ncbi:uncharacterized protein UV8b_04932 [Ustilaginoidea virens]|uniref:Uncharacterized protein n=1 Tax=Ustilaginoidea virens TaxID=1159556 RepID=A0A8E5MIG1_USTVR|nr:uncharacterized protein UV8b_04932 [Ustilaginoidea virens]QUC20691.1 hypothetical protein UV8b_04932 [Ustilaginoidea virens]
MTDASVSGDSVAQSTRDESAVNLRSNRDATTSTSACQSSGREEGGGADANQNDPPTESAVSKLGIFQQRAKRLGEKYGLVIEPSDSLRLTPNETAHRVDKPIRMRIRRTCHQCNTTFSARRECSKCRHVRCDKCPQFPPRKAEPDRLAGLEEPEPAVKASREDPSVAADVCWRHQRVQRKRASKTGGQDLVHRRPRQRVRRMCHECETLFGSGSKNCAFCGHVRCTDCPRDPPKKGKYPFGYPGDAFGPATEAHFECNACETLYPLEAVDGTPCQNCGLQKSAAAPRAAPRKIQPLPDLDLAATIAATSERLRTSSS